MPYRLCERIAPPRNCKGATDKLFCVKAGQKTFRHLPRDFLAQKSAVVSPLTSRIFRAAYPAPKATQKGKSFLSCFRLGYYSAKNHCTCRVVGRGFCLCNLKRIILGLLFREVLRSAVFAGFFLCGLPCGLGWLRANKRLFACVSRFGLAAFQGKRALFSCVFRVKMV